MDTLKNLMSYVVTSIATSNVLKDEIIKLKQKTTMSDELHIRKNLDNEIAKEFEKLKKEILKED